MYCVLCQDVAHVTFMIETWALINMGSATKTRHTAIVHTIENVSSGLDPCFSSPVTNTFVPVRPSGGAGVPAQPHIFSFQRLLRPVLHLYAVHQHFKVARVTADYSSRASV